jgi:hypothetical protein
MTSLTSLYLNSSTTQLANLLGIGANQGSTQQAGSANDSFAALLAQSLATQSPAQSTASTAATNSSGSSSLSTDLTALGQALSSGNLAAAQQAFQSMQTDLQGTTGTQQAHHHHHHHQDQDAASSASTASTTTQAASATQGGSSGTSLLDLLMATTQTA